MVSNLAARGALQPSSGIQADAEDPVWDDVDVLWPFEVLGVEELWQSDTDFSAGGVGVLIADWGILDGHPDLDFVEPVESVLDDGVDERLRWDFTRSSHGTAIAGIACGSHNGAGVFGVADGCDLYGFDMLYDLSRDDPEAARFADPRMTAIVLATRVNAILTTRPGIRVVNASWGFGPTPFGTCEEVADLVTVWAMERLMSLNPDVLFVVSAGNCGIEVPAGSSINDLVEQPIPVPAGLAAFLENVVSVTAVNEDLSMPEWANYGAAVAVAAPGGLSRGGEEIWGASFECADSCEPSFIAGSGTSYAAPFVTGTAALMFAANPELMPLEAIGCLRNSGIEVGEGIVLAAPADAIICARGIG